MKIYFPQTAARIAQLHELGLDKQEGYDLTPLDALDKNHLGDPDKINEARKAEQREAKKLIKKNVYASTGNRRAV